MYAIVNLEGRLVSDPEIKTGHNNREFCTFRVAVNLIFHCIDLFTTVTEVHYLFCFLMSEVFCRVPELVTYVPELVPELSS